jgi:hypothetical protein
MKHKIHLEVSYASYEAIKAVEKAGGTVTCVHFNTLGTYSEWRHQDSTTYLCPFYSISFSLPLSYHPFLSLYSFSPFFLYQQPTTIFLLFHNSLVLIIPIKCIVACKIYSFLFNTVHLHNFFDRRSFFLNQHPFNLWTSIYWSSLNTILI